jgi:integrase
VTKPYYLTKRGDIWYVRFRDPRTGEILNPKSSGHKNKTRAEDWCREKLGILSKPGGQLTFGEWAAPFFGPKCPRSERRAAEGDAYSPNTLTNYKLYLNNIVLKDKTLCDKTLSEVKRGDIIAFRNRVVALKGAGAVVEKVLDVMRAIMAEAEYLEKIEYNPVSKVKSLDFKVNDTLVLTAPEIKKLLNPAYFDEYRYFQATAIAAYTGARAAEVRCLKFRDIKLDARKLRIERAFKSKGHVVGVPKGGYARFAAIPEILVPILGTHKNPDMWIVGLGPKRPLGYKKWHDQFAAACVKAGVKATIKSLRHSLNTLLREKGVPDELLKASFGWSGSGIQENYTHRDTYDLSPVSRAIDSLFKEPENGNDSQRNGDASPEN